MAELLLRDGPKETQATTCAQGGRQSRCRCTGSQDWVWFDIGAVGIALLLLLALGISTETPIFESIRHSRLTFVAVLLVGLMFLIVRVAGQQLRIVEFVRDWGPIIALFAVYENLKHLHANRITEWLYIAPKDQLMASIDKLLFGAVLPLRLESISPPWLLKIMWVFYFWVYYLGPTVLLVWAYFHLKDRRLFGKLRHALVIGLLGGYVFYLLVPVAGPLFTYGDQFSTPISTHPVIGNLVFNHRYNWDCFPSLHTAIPWLLCFLTWASFARIGRTLCLLAALGVTCSTVFLRFHYGIDVIAGLGWAALVFWITCEQEKERTQRLAIADTNKYGSI